MLQVGRDAGAHVGDLPVTVATSMMQSAQWMIDIKAPGRAFQVCPQWGHGLPVTTDEADCRCEQDAGVSKAALTASRPAVP